MLPPVLPPARPDGRNRSTWPPRWMVLCTLGLVLLIGGQACVPPPPRAIPPTPSPAFQDGPAIQVQQTPWIAPATCQDRFVVHRLDHVTTTEDGVIRSFQANGAGVAVHDLDNDGDLDIALGGATGSSHIYWNRGGWQFEAETWPVDWVRAVLAVDVDGDNWTDLVVTRAGGAVNFFHNQGAAVPPHGPNRFRQEYLDGFAPPAYSMDWADLDGDGDLDAVTASYDAALLEEQGSAFLMSGRGGVYVHENRDGAFQASQLASESQGLTLVLADLDEDGRSDILVGNDFAVPDMAWRNAGSAWEAFRPFSTTTHSTMSFDVGDVNRDGHLDLFATDMMPYADDPETLAAWAPLMAEMAHPMDPDDPQIMENVLQIGRGQGRYTNQARAWGVHATGWSWSGLFGDLDLDGWTDLYVVNGFAEATMFAHLPNHELVEENQAFRNREGTGFEPRPDWGLNGTEGGRGLALADLDNDGDLDAVVNNLRAPAVIYENRLCRPGTGVSVTLRWPSSGNTQAVGALVRLRNAEGNLLAEDRVRVARGYLSGDAGRLHLAAPGDETTPLSLEIRWPDGRENRVLLQGGQHVRVERQGP